ncbi:hypothetical protein [Lysinibacillus sp. NPDC086135]|uniref:hypothetical protein n=1 Tax=Lysinibacillus sp. NPDC086135 TaxID=3364130 RepID=UPI0038059ABF
MYGIDGLSRSFFLLLLPASGHLLDMIFGAPSVVFGLLAAGLLYHIIQSITANTILTGRGQWVPDWILTKLTDWVRSEIEGNLHVLKNEKRRKREKRNEYHDET